MPYTREELLHRARGALALYPLEVVDLRLLGHSDNLTFRVEAAGGGLYLLRLHDPVSAYYRGLRQQPEAIASELVWMEALYQQGGVVVQQPVHSCTGEPIVLLPAEQGPPLPCTLLTWLDGAHFSPSAPDAGLLAGQLGMLAARMHDFSSRWEPPQGLVRPQYDGEHFRRIFARLLRGADLGIFSETVYRTFRTVAREIMDEISRLSSEPGAWGMIHADLHVGNFLVSGQEVVPIDFSFCGFGHYLFDLSVCLGGGLNPGLRRAFLVGYRSQRELSESSIRAVEAYALAGRVSYYAYQVDHPAERRWLQQRLPQVAENECMRFLRGESILDVL